MGAHLDGIQTAVLLVLAVVGAGAHRTLDGVVGGAGAAVVHAVAHRMVPPCFLQWVLPGVVCAVRPGLMQKNRPVTFGVDGKSLAISPTSLVEDCLIVYNKIEIMEG